jgi:lipopolysaccharide transport system ATP-binding protein
MATSISVENLSKKYTISHQRQERYTALRDVLANGVKRSVNRLLRRRTGDDLPKHEEFWALKDVNFEIKQGDRVGIIGRNGAGKSTLLKILSRITEPTGGRVKIVGRVASLLEVGTGFHPELTGRENIYLNGAILGMTHAEMKSKFDQIVDFAEVEKFLDTPVKRYSSGMYVRLAFAVSAHLEPDILILDEVLAVGDSQFQKKCLGKMGEVTTEGRTVIFVSHSMGMVAGLCNRAMLLNKGGIVTSGDTTAVIERYLSDAASEDNTAYVAVGKKDSDIYVETIQAISANGVPTNVFPHNEPITIDLRCTINRWVADSVMGFFVVDQRGRKVFTSKNEKWGNIRPDDGHARIVVTIPRDFLVPGQYSFSFVISVPHVRTVDSALDALSINVIDAGTIYASYEGYDYGCVFANCDWRVQSEHA